MSCDYEGLCAALQKVGVNTDKDGPSINQSGVAACLGCKRKYLYKYRWQLRHKAAESNVGAASLGKIFHKFMEHGVESAGTEQWVRKQQEKLMAQVEAGMDLTGAIAGKIKTWTDLYNKAKMMATLFYVDHPMDEHLEVICREQSVETTLTLPSGRDNYSLPVTGTIDIVIRDTRNGDIWIRDSKTTSRDILWTIAGYQWSTQCRLYRLLVQDIEEVDRPPKGFILDIAKVPTIKFCRKDKDFDAYIERCRQWYKKEETPPFRSQGFVYREPELAADFVSNLNLVDVYRTLPTNPEDFPRDGSTSHCKAWQRLCSYYDLCNTDYAAWPDLIERDFSVQVPEELEREDPVKEGVE